MTSWVPAGKIERSASTNTRGPTHGAVEPPVFSFGHAATAGEGPARVHSEELQDAQWWKKGGASTVNQEQNRDVEGYWAAANEMHANVGGDLRKIARTNREKGLSAQGSKTALAGNREDVSRPRSLYKETFAGGAEVVAAAAQQMTSAARRAASVPSAAASAAYRESHDAAAANKKLARNSNLTLAQEML